MAKNTEASAIEGSSRSEVKPEWIRPKQVPELFGIGRGIVNYLITQKKIKSISLCHDGLGRGTRLISYASMCEYLEGIAAEQTGKGNEQAAAEGGAA